MPLSQKALKIVNLKNYLYFSDNSGTLYQGDALEVLKQMPDESINCVVTSPPYWALRDYGVEGQLGLEPDFNEYLEKLWTIFDEIYRVLKKDGTCWVNLGDTYYGGGKGETNGMNKPAAIGGKRFRLIKYQPKSLCLIPERFAIGMVERGWILRNKIVWHKPNVLPESVKDRFTRSYEYIFFFTKSRKYYFEQQLEPANYDGRDKDIIEPSKKYGTRNYPGGHPQQMARKPMKRWPLTLNGQPARNKRDVWNISTKGFPGAHFAVFPPDLPANCIKAGCPVGGVVLDPFMGSGTTAVVAKKLQRKWVGIELNPDYCRMIKARVKSVLL